MVGCAMFHGVKKLVQYWHGFFMTFTSRPECGVRVKTESTVRPLDLNCEPMPSPMVSELKDPSMDMVLRNRLKCSLP